MKKVGIIGFGRFGKTLVRLLGDEFDIYVYDRKKKSGIVGERKGKMAGRLEGEEYRGVDNIRDIYEICDVIFFCVPIPKFETVIKSHKKYFADKHLLIDVLSVKVHAKKVFEKYLKNTNVKALLTHPMFGPDSSRNGFTGLPIVVDKFRSNDENYNFWKKLFSKRGLKVVEMSAEEHDRLAANSQGVTHFIGRLLEEFKLQPTSIDTLGSKKLLEIMDQTCNDTWELFAGLQNYNSYTKKMRLKLGKAYDIVYEKLLPHRVEEGSTIYGIQGGVGSFNEQAVHFYLEKHKIRSEKIKYLYTTERVLNELHKGNIDFGQFAIHNSVGGIVGESIEAMAKYKFKIVEEFAIIISHHLMKRKDVDIDDINTIMAHPQVLAQCKHNLEIKYKGYKLTSGRGDMVDTAMTAKALAEGKLPGNIAILGPKILSDIYNFDIVANDLQDSKENYTSFLLVSR